ncbi:MAG TPA: hypothetical protein VHS09_12655 [Polyangiaceae bacterium]|nr:hypothetical protein [Polyangiaceae bacterium]
MSPDRFVRRPVIEEELRLDQRPTIPPPAKRPSGMRRKAPVATSLDPLEEALLSRPLWDSREPEPAVHELLYRFAVGDEAGAIAAAGLLLDGRRVPALTVSLDVLDELELDHRAALVLAQVDGTTPLSELLGESCLSKGDALRTLCELVERRILVLRAPK